MRLSSARPVTLIGGAPVGRADLDLALRLAPVVAAADSGADTALSHGLMPAAVWGDFDSISARARSEIPLANQHPIAEQDSTDFEKCLSNLDAPFVVALGFSGARHDHFLSALGVIARRIGPPCLLVAGEDVITLAPPRLALDLAPGTRVSLFAMAPASGRSSGLKWPLDGLAFAPTGLSGTSNEATGPVTLECEGPMLLILPRSELPTLARAL
ncbi:thiamine diphosphokinase [Paracoccus versutus]|uniref:Thiamine diphosphokinase n=1 Tax=Paracoccus versutus TaxID=34007 RepID=A0AAQ0KPC8_PARVE|nr:MULTISPECIES: thiamine diphosphokinase [Paracoccus]KGJ12176.1 thiamine pyrophosphokinase [Paracoccus versutus]MBT0779770.1 thiamine diphosphokinase [Paracoccus sp. pheM1]RDD73057.1 thiamine diphosphokinase [Paracoccus versutus]REG57108.1 thiamine pyrophosphokinase [Paracoccus versutus]WEJ77956.1 thiamine diphosphokinase [Paracoccus versutus]